MFGNLQISFTVSCTAQICMEVAANGRFFATIINSISHKGVIEQLSIAKHTMEATVSYFSMKPIQEVCPSKIIERIALANVPTVKPFASDSFEGRETTLI